MKFFDVLENVLQAALLKFRSYRTKYKDDQTSESTPEFTTHEHLERLQAQVHYLGYEVETMRQVGIEVVKRMDNQTILIEELSGMLEAIQQTLNDASHQAKPVQGHAAPEPSQKPKKQILN